MHSSKVESPLRARLGYAFVKRAIDIGGALVLLGILAPVMVITALAILFTSRGSLFFRHRRVGQYGEPISVIKFRTMVVDAPAREAEARETVLRNGDDFYRGPAFKAADDPRVTSIGRLLRRSSIDELPQLFNVLGGSMSLVGPRPLVEDEVGTLSSSDRAMRQRAKPGITGLWQTSGRNLIPFEDRIALDLEYVGRRSIWLDIVLLLKTPLAVIRGNGAY